MLNSYIIQIYSTNIAICYLVTLVNLDNYGLLGIKVQDLYIKTTNNFQDTIIEKTIDFTGIQQTVL